VRVKAAVVVSVEIRDIAAADKFSEDTGVPGARSTPGFVSGTWTRDRENRRGVTVMIFESREQADAAAEQAQTRLPAEAPVHLVSVEVLDVVAEADH
jgi:hypothetical protein